MLELDGIVIDRGGFRLSADLKIGAGALVAVVGESGSGKSTLLEAVAGFVAPARGRLLWRGQEIGALPPGDRPVTMIFQDHNLFPHLSVERNVALGLSPALRLTDADRDRVHAALGRVGLAGQAGAKPAALSGGQRSRVALARAILRRRPLVLMDEPFSALGPAMKADMLDLTAEVLADEGATLLMVTHDPADARRIASQIVMVADGQAAPPVATAAVLDAPPEALRGYFTKD